ncbi:MAG TPA: ATP-binding protein [Steroidobacteraceae bacterium]|jgi:hypothetical protein|nr:ATP-binding protein [Steroidobacteraceae bacterium]
MSKAGLQRWHSANDRYLRLRLAILREGLKRHAQAVHGIGFESIETADSFVPALQEARNALPAPASLDRITAVFGLSEFEENMLLLSAGGELDPTFAMACGAAQGLKRAGLPNFGLALAVLPDPNWNSLTPAAPLRHWRFLEMSPDSSLSDCSIRIDERILHYLRGMSYLDARLRANIEVVAPPGAIPESQQKVARELAACLANLQDRDAIPLLQLCGDESAGKRAVAAASCELLEVQLHVIRSSDLPPSSAERAAFRLLWHREALLSNSALLVEYDEHANDATIASFIERLPGMVLVATREPLAPARSTIRFDVNKPTAAEQRALWMSVLGENGRHLNGHLEMLASHFDLSAPEIHAAGIQALAGRNRPAKDPLEASLYSACRMQTRQRIRDLAQHIEPAAGWPDLVLPDPQLQTLRDMVAQVRHRTKVYEEWGFASKSPRGLGISALFAGASGTGKTLAAEVIAGELQIDLCLIDLSQVVSKYIGETEKNLRNVFDAAQGSGAVLFFDEADALFGKRSDVKDSHDRYANIEVSYLLQRMEAYRGLAILTTNMQGLIDTAFLRRLRFIVKFPFPDADQRTAIWRRAFPATMPVENVQPERLAQLNVSGGSIRNIALHASFYAADSGEPVQMKHLLRAAHLECAKLDKGISPQETHGWV